MAREGVAPLPYLIVQYAVRGDRWPAGPSVVDQLDPPPAVDVVHPQAVSAVAPRRCGDVGPLHDQVLPVRRPSGRRGTGVQVRKDRPRVGPVCAHDPEVVLPLPVGDEGDPLAVRREARVVVQGDTRVLRQVLGVAPFCGHAIDVAQEIEDDPLTIRRDIDGEPGSLVRREFDRSGFPAGLGDIPLVLRRES